MKVRDVIAHVLCSRGYDLPWSAVSVSVQQDMLEDADAILAAVAPLIRRAALEEAAGVVQCGCANRALVAETAARCGPNSGARWGLCGEAHCGALDAAAIRALDT
jgi:hypothetical protein